jgi:hypothetical protein
MKAKIGNYSKGDKPRKIDIEIDRYDTWSMDHTLAVIILPMLLQLKETKMGVPAEFSDNVGADYDMQASFDFCKEDHDWAFDQNCKRWEEILDKMIWSFQQIVYDDYEQEYHHGTPNIGWEKSDYTYVNPSTGKTEETFQMVDKNPTEHYTDYTGMRLHEERIQEGLELFGKYFRNLWD